MSKKLSRKTNAWAALFHGGAVEFHPSRIAALASLATGHGGTVVKVLFDTSEFRAQRAVVKAAMRHARLHATGHCTVCRAVDRYLTTMLDQLAGRGKR